MKPASQFLILTFLTTSVLCQVDYSDQIQPIFNNNCTVCHGGIHSTGLDLTSHSGVMAGSNNGAVVLPNNSTESLLWQYVDNGFMPYFSDDLTSPEIDSIAQWINQGALLSTIYDDHLFPEKLSIIGNFPNPFNPVTHFQVFSPIAQQGKVSIINLAGQRVVDLGGVHLNPGNQIFSWDHQTFINLPSGPYLFYLKTDELMVTHRISLIK